jgi:hypothetical protein
MAASKFWFYDAWGKYEASGDVSFMNAAGVTAVLLKSSYTPGTSTHSVAAQVTNHQATSSGSIVNSLTLAGKHISTSGTNVIKYIASDIDAFSAGGSEIKAKYLALYANGTLGGVLDPVIGFLDLNTGSTTGVEASQIKITWPSGGIAKKLINH